MTGDATTFGARLRDARRSAGLTQEELAGRSGLTGFTATAHAPPRSFCMIVGIFRFTGEQKHSNDHRKRS
jgi:transcriptional regulator with XRE-family HTH domain